jgi:excisionase family DNA binding protein
MTEIAFEQDPLLTVREMSAATRLKEPTIRDWILKKRIPYVKLGRRVFIQRSTIEAFIRASVVPAAITVVKETQYAQDLEKV